MFGPVKKRSVEGREAGGDYPTVSREGNTSMRQKARHGFG